MRRIVIIIVFYKNVLLKQLFIPGVSELERERDRQKESHQSL